MNFNLFKNIMKHKSDVPGQLTLLTVAPTSEIKLAVHDPCWDEVEIAPQHPQPEDRWNPADFGDVAYKLDDGDQLTIFYDDSDEPPDPDDYQTLSDYHQAWAQWRPLVGGQVTTSTIDTTVKTRVGGQVINDTQKSAHQHNTHWLEKYWVQRGSNKYWYYRYCYREGGKKKRVYIGSVDSILAKRKKADVEVWISDGQSPLEIQKLIQSWSESHHLPSHF